jgi:general secretion pathway protein K
MNYKTTKTRQRGFIIVVVLCMIIMLGVILLGFNQQTRRYLLATDDVKKSAQALNCARTGLNIAIAAIKQTDTPNTGKDLFNLLSTENNVQLEDGKCSFVVYSESGRLNVNMLKNRNSSINRKRTDQLLRLIDLLNQTQPQHDRIGYGLVPAIMDWTDSDNDTTALTFVSHQNTGAESAYYQNMDQPYKCANEKLKTTGELMMVKAITPQIFHRLRDFLTVYGDGQVNINSAPKLVIQSLSQNMDSAIAQIIIDQRRIRPFESVTQLQQLPGMSENLYEQIFEFITTSPTDQYYQVMAKGNVGQITCRISAVLKKNLKTKNIEVVLYRET